MGPREFSHLSVAFPMNGPKSAVVAIHPSCLDSVRSLLRDSDYAGASEEQKAAIDGFAVPDADFPPSQSSADEEETKTDEEEEEEIQRIDPDGNDKEALLGISEEPRLGQVSIFGVAAVAEPPPTVPGA